MQIDLLPFIVEALGYNHFIYPDIDRLYQTQKYEFYNAAKEHYLYMHPIVTEGGLLQEEYCKKALGIILHTNDDEEANQALSGIFRKGWTYAYLFVENHTEIDLDIFLKNAVRKAGGADKITDDWINSQVLIVYFLAINSGKKVVENEFLPFFQNVLAARWQHYHDNEPTRISLKNASPDRLEKVKMLKRQIYEQYGKITDYNSMYGKLQEQSETFAFLFDFENLSFPSIIESVKFSGKDIDEILLAYTSRNNVNNIENTANFLCSAMYIKYMAKAYNDVKRRYFENNRETMYIEMEGLGKKLNEANQETKRLSGDLSEIRKSYELLKKENARILKELTEEKKNRQELNSLREFLFSLDQQEEHTQQDEAYNLDELKTFKAVLISGHEKWQVRMKELLPGFIFIHPDNKSFDVRLLEGTKAIFIYVNYISHAIYKRVMESIEGKNIHIAYINKQNEERVLWEIYKALQGLKKY